MIIVVSRLIYNLSISEWLNIDILYIYKI